MLCALLANFEKKQVYYAVKVSGSFSDGSAKYACGTTVLPIEKMQKHFSAELLCFFPEQSDPLKFIHDEKTRDRAKEIL